MEIVAMIVFIGVGFVAGMYVSTQIENHIDKNTKK